MGILPTRPARLRFGVFEVDPESGELRKQGRRIKLPDQSFQILLALLERPGEVVTRQELQQRLWPGDTFVDFDANLNTAISLLRDALGDSAKSPRFIETLPRRGYRFLDAVAGEEAAPPLALPPAPAGAPPAPFPARRLLVGAVCLAVLAAGVLWYRSTRAPADAFESIAVLPLVYAGPEGEDQQYLADGLTSALITELARLGVPNVISETSVMQYRDIRKPLPEIGRELGADVLVEGSVTREGDTVRVNAQLIDARTDTHLWARTYQREMDSLLDLQNEIATAIVREVRTTLQPSARAGRAAAEPVDPSVHEAYLRGRFALRNDVEGRRVRAREFFEEAIRLDPSFAPAYAGLADYFGFTDAVPPGEAFAKSRGYALQALRLDDTLSGPHLSLALASMWSDWDWTAAARQFERSLELDPGDTTARRWYALFLDLTGRPRAALAQLQRVRAMDPLSPRTYHALGHHYFLQRRYDEALEQIRAVEDLDPHDPLVFEARGSLYVYTGAYEQAIAAAGQGIALWGRDASFIAALGIAHARAGQREQAGALLDELHGLARQRHIPPCWFATIYMNLGDRDRAFEWLETAYRTRDAYLVHLQASPQFDPVRGDARFANLLQRMNFPPPEGS